VIEREHHKRAFETYYGMGHARSLTKVAKKIKMSVSVVKLWSREFDWQTRVDERERDVARVMAKSSIQAEADTRLRNKQLLQLALVQIAKQLAEGKVRVTLADLDRLVRLEQFLEGQADSRQEIIARDLRGKSTEELREMLRQEVADLEALTKPSPN
jgi:hypothetical protein